MVELVNLSVVVCTFNRSESLKKTLRGLSEASVPEGCAWEIVIVDNRSTDETRAVIEAFRAASKLSVAYAYEPKPGLSHARNRGLAVAKGAIIAFTDDDVLVDRSWLLEILRESRSGEGADMIFGQTRRYSEDMPRLSVKEDGARQWYAFPCSPWSVGHGNNMILMRSVVLAVGTFDPWFGAGTRIGAAEDTDYVYRVLRSSRKILYSPAIIVYHDHGRVSGDLVRRIERNYAKGRGAFYCKHILRGDVWTARLLYRELRVLAGMVLEGREKRGKSIFNVNGLLHGAAIRIFLELTHLLDGLRGKSEFFRCTG
jgi:glycosyltransferase involved in cell wall biosynthesis